MPYAPTPARSPRRRRPRHSVGVAVVSVVAALVAGFMAWPGAEQADAAPSTGGKKAAAVSSITAEKAAAPSAFVHPGVTVSRGQLDFAREKVTAGAQPWKSAYDQMTGSTYASLSRTPKPRAVVECGSYSDPNHGCTDEREDAIAAYTTALAWYITRDERYAKKSIELMDAWSAVLKDHTNSNAPLQTGWAGSSWPRAAEIIKHTYTGTWANSGRFATMLRGVYLPEIINGSNSNGNWELSMMEAAIGISVFLEDKASYDKAMATFRTRTAAYVYLASDGALPKTVPSQHLDTREKIVKYWQGQGTFTTGLTQETCRDFTHTGYGLSAISHVAETSRIQGEDLYGTDVGERLRQGLGFQATYELGEAPPASLCKGTVHRGLGPVTEVGYNALAGRLGHAMTNTRKLTERNRPAGSNNLFVAWETLTHAGNPR
ncbi:alginate lyase family protein [Streptomyces luteocolor]|uniref:alginate lyase family protein n=1 Tax=Streptomyces luteocolor TaxID=285500 RepID=UPI000852D63B|nr:alginate lyase family protein [Streptomyces luteocolor]